jgi:hypothetical protein
MTAPKKKVTFGKFRNIYFFESPCPIQVSKSSLNAPLASHDTLVLSIVDFFGFSYAAFRSAFVADWFAFVTLTAHF